VFKSGIFNLKIKMMKPKFRIPLKLKLFLPVTIIIIIVVVFLTIWFINKSISSFENHIQNNLELEVNTISKMFERESALKLEKVQNNLKVAHSYFFQTPLIITSDTIHQIVENQKNNVKHEAVLNKWYHNNKLINCNNDFVDSLESVFGGTISVFQRIDSGFVRISTNVRKFDGTRAVLTYIPMESPVVNAIMKGEKYYGRALVLNEWYTTAYEPFYTGNEIVGMLYVGDKEKDMSELTRIINTLKIGKSGYPFVFDKHGNFLIHPESNTTVFEDEEVLKKIIENKEGVIEYKQKGKTKTMAYKYFEKFELYIGASVVNDVESVEFVHNAIKGAAIVGLISILFLLIFIYRFTSEKLYRYFNALQVSNKKLANAELALKHSEKLANMGQISAGIAHELNNPLGVITMYSNIVLDELDENDPKRQDLQLIADQSIRCKNIVSNLLNFARKNKIKVEEVDIYEFIQKTLNSVVIPKNVKTDINCKIKNKIMMIDAEQMMQAFTNLEKNAVEAMPEGGTLSVSIEEENNSVIIYFEDEGIGIAEENIEKLFTPFFTTKEIGKGTGLGLPLVYGIIKMHNGKIAVNSNNNPENGKTGTTFMVKLPRIN